MGRALIVGDLLLKSNMILPNRIRGSAGFTGIERLIPIVLVMIQFTQIATFIMIMPLGDRLRRELSLTSGQLVTVATSGFMVFAAARMVPAQAMLLTTVSPNIRGAFMSVNTSVCYPLFPVVFLFCSLAFSNRLMTAVKEFIEGPDR